MSTDLGQPESRWERSRARNEAAVRASIDSIMRDTKYDRLRGRGTRRALVVVMVLLLAAVLPTYALLGTIAGTVVVLAGIVVLVALRQATRIVADAPPELLDERQRTVQGRTYLTAFRLVGGVATLAALAGFVAVLFSGDPEQVVVTLDTDVATGIGMTVIGAFLAAPTCVYAWEAEQT